MPGLLSVMRPKVGAVDVERAYVGGAQVGQMRENLFTNPSFEATSGTAFLIEDPANPGYVSEV